MNPEEFIRKNLEVAAQGRFPYIIDEVIDKFKRNDYSSVPNLISTGFSKIDFADYLSDWVTVKDFALRYNVCESTARRRLNKIEGITCNKEKRPYKYIL